MDEGWIKLHRKLLSSEIWYKERFSRGQAWVDLILLANHKEKIIIKHDKVIPIKRGQVGHSVLDLSLRWKWSRTKVDSFLIYLENQNQIQVEKKQRVTTIISITNYDKYQQKNMEKNNEKTTRRQREDINKNVKNVKKEESKDKYLDFVFLTQEEHTRLTEEFGKNILKEMILELDNYIGAMPKKRNKYTDHNRVLRGWVKEKILGNKSKAEAAPKLPYYPTMNTEKPDGTEKYRDVSKLASGLKEL